MAVIVTTETLPRPLPVDLVDGPGGLLYLVPHAPLTPADCEALSALLAARAAATHRPSPRTAPAAEPPPPVGPSDEP